MLSVKYSVPVCMIARANRGFKEGLRPGMQVLIPPSDFCSMAGGEYIVKEDESLVEISNKTGATMRDILHINSVAPREIREGMCLFLPKKSRIYTVGCAETLEEVVKNSGVCMEDISALNDISGGIYRGMQLKLPWD